VPLDKQDRARWDRSLIAAGLAELRRAVGRERLGPYQLQAMIAACHVAAGSAADTDWARIVELYDALLAQVPSPTVVLNRAVAVAMRSGAQAGLDLLDDLAPDGAAWSGRRAVPSSAAAHLKRSRTRVSAAPPRRTRLTSHDRFTYEVELKPAMRKRNESEPTST
jgi:RNA polymerase sigma-70 factor (ECF subfamily)